MKNKLDKSTCHLILLLVYIGITASYAESSLEKNNTDLIDATLVNKKNYNEVSVNNSKIAPVHPKSIPFKNKLNRHPVTAVNPLVFSAEDVTIFTHFFKKNGYVVIDNISSKDHRDQLVKLMDKISEKNTPNTRRLAFMELYHDKTLADLRQNNSLYKAFTHIYGTEKLWVVFDRVIYWNKDETEMPLAPHVDQNPIQNPDFSYVQAMLALKDMNEDTGTLALVPASKFWFSDYKKWSDKKAGYIEYEGDKPLSFIAIRLKEGQLVIWDSRTTHSRFRGKPTANRYAALISFTKAIDSPELLKIRRQFYDTGMGYNHHEAGLRATAKPRYKKSLRENSESLTTLGKKLYGLDSWFNKRSPTIVN